jgi:hypothetical protein
MWANIKAILTTITTVKEIFSMAVKLYDKWLENKRLKRKEEIRKSVDNVIKNKDQREFEKAIGSSNAGKPSKHKLDSVQRRARKDRG